MANPCKRKLGTCPPCNCGTVQRPRPTDCRLQQWLSQANAAGRKWGMNPVTFLAIASIETEGDPANWDTGNGAYGIVQATQWYLTPYNCFNRVSYRLSDLAAKGPNITTNEGAVELSFDLLGQFMRTFNDAHSSFRLTATAWNGTGCGWDGRTYLFPWSNRCGGVKDPTNYTCYGQAAFDIAASYSPYWTDPSTGRPNSYYFGDLPHVPATGPCYPVPDEIAINLG